MSKVTMPEPAAYVNAETLERYPTYLAFAEKPSHKNVMFVSLFTTTQAEAYAAAKVREALKEAAWIVDLATQSHHVECWDNLESLATRIRALIPSTAA